MSETNCPVCHEEFGNPGALGTHLSLTKDTLHTAHRAGTEAGEAPTPALPSPEAPAVLLLPAPAPPAPAPEMVRVEPPSEPLPFLLPPPEAVSPLLPPEGKAKASVTVPLEPILAGTVAISLNAIFLSNPGDGKLTPERVTQTGFPSAVESSLRLYFPELPLDHPITALIASSAGLAMAVVELKGKTPQAPEPSHDDAQEAGTQAGGHAGEARQAGTQTGGQAASTGDPYWDAILRNAGGVRA